MGEHSDDMTLDGAIEHLDELLSGSMGSKCAAEHEQLRGWLAELLERRSASGCDHCVSWCHKPIVDTGTLMVCVTTGANLYTEFHGTFDQEYDETPINFCPKCGRDLRGGAE